MMEFVFVTAVETVCGLGLKIEECLQALRMRQGCLRELGESRPETTAGSFAELPVGPISSPKLGKGRRYGAASNMAVVVARDAVQRAGWTPEMVRESWLYGASSRGNAGEMMGRNAWRRPMRRFSASNSMHSEIAAAVSIELGIRGPWQMCSNGCSSGLDALGMAWMAVGSGLAPRALVVAVDLPLVEDLLADFRDTGLLSSNGINDPFSISGPHATSGFLPGEAAVAVTIERAGPGVGPLCRLEHYAANSDAYDSLMIPEDGGGITDCVRMALESGDLNRVMALCPHATGTLNHARVEPPALMRALAGADVPLIPLKPNTGHTLGASGLLDVALLAACLREGWLPPVLSGLSAPECGLRLLEEPLVTKSGDRVIKLASGMGGHNAAVSLVAV